jgi:uncharacterized protein YdeI (YjbR/CyaY-like superfamily)
MPKPRTKSFRATLERIPSRLNWVIIRIPFDVLKIWGTRGRLKVRGEINGFAYRSSLFPTREGKHLMIVNKRMQAGAKVTPGKVAQFRMQSDLEERTVSAPAELKRFLAKDRALRGWYDRLNYSTRKDIATWITDVKSAEARERRAEQIAERLLLTMEAEQELPPILRVAFAREPRAGQGWELMSLSRRRGHLFGIFYYRDPEARARRVNKAVEDAVDVASRCAK